MRVLYHKPPCNHMSSTVASKSKICWLDLRRSGLSVIERLVLEEALLRHDKRQWAISKF